MGRKLIAGLVGGLVVFVWSFVAHMVLPIGAMGLKHTPNEDALAAAMEANLDGPGIYLIPGMDMRKAPTPAEWDALVAKLQAGPTAFLVYHPSGGEAMSGRQLGLELLGNVLAALVIALVLGQLVGSLASRAILVGLLGAFAWFSLSFSHWVWYRFPKEYVIGEGLDLVIGWVIAGFVMAAIVKPPAR